MSDDNSELSRRDVLKSSAKTSGIVVAGGLIGSATATADHSGTCRPESYGKLQGQVPLDQQLNGRSKDGYCNNVHLVGKNTIGDRGANFQLAWYGDYAYVGMAHLADRGDPGTDDPLWGTAVVDASDPADPTVTEILKTPANFNLWEAVDVSEKRDLMVVVEGNNFDVIDLSDPAHPDLIVSAPVPVESVHSVILSSDGKTAYVNSSDNDDPGFAAVSLDDPANPEVLATYSGIHAHDLGIGLNDEFLYVAYRGVRIMDIREIERREDDPEFRMMGTNVNSGDGTHAGETFRRNGRQYFITQDEADGDGKLGGCPWGFARIWDVEDPTAPRQVGQFKLEVNKYANCGTTQEDTSLTPGVLTATSFYSSHYNGITRQKDPRLSFFSWYGSGLRVTDIRNHEAPVEVAYYNPPPNPDTKFSHYSPWSAVDKYLDATTSYVRYRPKTGNIWFVSVANGFQIAELTGPAAEIPR